MPKTKTQKIRTPRRREPKPGVIQDLAAEASSIYLGNSAAKDEAIDAQLAYDRADAWARSPAGTPYGSATPAWGPRRSGT
jgi:hypothetical protein